MAGDKKEGVLFTLKELKDITADEPARAAAPARSAPAPSRPRSSSVLGDASSLLADIRDSVVADAAEERARIEAAKEAARRAAEDEEARRQEVERAAVAARLAAEEARQRAAAEERDARHRAIDLAERRARGEFIEEDQPRPRVQVERSPALVSEPVGPARRGTGFYLAVVGVPVLCLTAVALAMILKPDEPARPTLPVSAIEGPAVVAVVAADEPSDMPVAIATEPPAPAAVGEPAAADGDVVAAADDDKKGGRKGGRKGGKKAGGVAKGDDDGKKAGGEAPLKLNLGGQGGGITF